MLAEEVDGNGVLPVAAIPPRQLWSGTVPEVLLRRVVERVVLGVTPEIGDEYDETREGIRAFPSEGTTQTMSLATTKWHALPITGLALFHACYASRLLMEPQ